MNPVTDARNDLLAAVTRTLQEANAARTYADSALVHAKDAQKSAQAAYDLVCTLIQDGKVTP